MQGNYKVVTLCGSPKFKREFLDAYNNLTVAGYIVISATHSDISELCDGADKKTKKLMMEIA